MFVILTYSSGSVGDPYVLQWNNCRAATAERMTTRVAGDAAEPETRMSPTSLQKQLIYTVMGHVVL